MTRITVSLPDDVAERARSAGLLSDRAIRQLLEDAMRREAGRKLLEVADKLRAANIAPMSDEEIVAEVKAVRAERRARSRQP
jgi:hypothetical protein